MNISVTNLLLIYRETFRENSSSKTKQKITHTLGASMIKIKKIQPRSTGASPTDYNINVYIIHLIVYIYCLCTLNDGRFINMRRIQGVVQFSPRFVVIFMAEFHPITLHLIVRYNRYSWHRILLLFRPFRVGIKSKLY